MKDEVRITDNCTFTEDGEMDPEPFLRKAHPEMSIENGSAFGLDANSVHDGSFFFAPLWVALDGDASPQRVIWGLHE